MTEYKAAGEGYDHSGRRNARGSAAGSPDKLEVGIHAGEQQKQQDAEIGHGLNHRFLLGSGRKNRVLRLWQKRAEYGGTKNHTGDQLSHHRRLADPLHHLTKKPRDQKRQHDLREEESFRGPGWGLLRRERGGIR